jgi:hypothetical protein
MKMAIVHLLKFNLHPKTPCGRINVSCSSGDVKKVTCESCRSTKIFMEIENENIQTDSE